MQSNIPQSPVYDDYNDLDNTIDDNQTYDSPYYHEHDALEPDNGLRRVVWLMLMVLLVIALASVIAFWFVPYFQMVSLGNPPPLPPAVQT